MLRAHIRIRPLSPEQLHLLPLLEIRSSQCILDCASDMIPPRFDVLLHGLARTNRILRHDPIQNLQMLAACSLGALRTFKIQHSKERQALIDGAQASEQEGVPQGAGECVVKEGVEDREFFRLLLRLLQEFRPRMVQVTDHSEIGAVE